MRGEQTRAASTQSSQILPSPKLTCSLPGSTKRRGGEDRIWKIPEGGLSGEDQEETETKMTLGDPGHVLQHGCKVRDRLSRALGVREGVRKCGASRRR